MKINSFLLTISLLPTILFSSCNRIEKECVFVEQFERYEEYQSGNRFLTEFNNIDEIEIYWNNGEINLVKDPTYSVISITESNCSHNEAEIPLQSLIYEKEDKLILSIHFLRPGEYIMSSIKKDLEVRVPETFQVDVINVHTITANLSSTINFNDGHFYSETGNAKIQNNIIHYLMTDSRHGTVEVESKYVHHFFAYNFYGKCTLKTDTFDVYEIRCETSYASLEVHNLSTEFSFDLNILNNVSGEFISNREYTKTEENKYLYGDSEAELIGHATVELYNGKFVVF